MRFQVERSAARPNKYRVFDRAEKRFVQFNRLEDGKIIEHRSYSYHLESLLDIHLHTDRYFGSHSGVMVNRSIKRESDIIAYYDKLSDIVNLVKDYPEEFI
ncbi:hypothetical protein [Vibrio phage phiKT1024]|nr:hypothetical protein [Vibrio phage phiKT1024]